MRRLSFILLIPLLLLPGLTSAELKPFVQANQKGVEFKAQFEWVDGNETFAVSARGVLTSKTNAARPALRLAMGKGVFIERLYVLKYENDQLLAFETNDGENTNVAVCRIKSAMESVIWCQTVFGFNLFAAATGDTIYLAAIGFIGRLDPADGKFLWKHDDLYNKDNTFNIVCPADETESVISFNATTGIKNLPVKQISLSKNTGKILKIEVINNPNVCQ